MCVFCSVYGMRLTDKLRHVKQQMMFVTQVPEYLAHVDKRLNEENERLLHYLDSSTK